MLYGAISRTTEMKILRIANIIGHADDRQAASRHSYEIPADAVSPGFEIGYVALARPQTMLNDLDRMVTELAYVEAGLRAQARSDEHTSELQSLMRNSYAVFCLKNK